MVHPNLQETLFKTSREDVLTSISIPLAMFTQWNKDGLISFNLADEAEISEPQSLECIFVAKLFSSNISLEIINSLLGKLVKPYAYDFNTIYFNVFKNEWEYLPVIPNDAAIVESYIENLTEDDKEEIEELINTLQNKL